MSVVSLKWFRRTIRKYSWTVAVTFYQSYFCTRALYCLCFYVRSIGLSLWEDNLKVKKQEFWNDLNDSVWNGSHTSKLVLLHASHFFSPSQSGIWRIYSKLIENDLPGHWLTVGHVGWRVAGCYGKECLLLSVTRIYLMALDSCIEKHYVPHHKMHTGQEHSVVLGLVWHWD